MMSHIARLKVDPEHRVIMHTHPTYTIAMNAVCPIDEVEKTAQIYMLCLGRAVNVIPDSIIKELAELWNLTPAEGILDA